MSIEKGCNLRNIRVYCACPSCPVIPTLGSPPPSARPDSPSCVCGSGKPKPDVHQLFLFQRYRNISRSSSASALPMAPQIRVVLITSQRTSYRCYKAGPSSALSAGFVTALLRERPLHFAVGDFSHPLFFSLHELERVGELGDGGKWVCGISWLQEREDCIVYSVVALGPSSSAFQTR